MMIPAVRTNQPANGSKPGVEILPGYGLLLGLKELTEWHGKANRRV